MGKMGENCLENVDDKRIHLSKIRGAKTKSFVVRDVAFFRLKSCFAYKV